MAGIRVSTGAKRIEVNDDGDYITLNFADQSFPERFFAMIDRVTDIAKEAEPREKELRETYPAGSVELARAVSSFNVEIHTAVSKEIDGFFGANTCKRVFGDIVPGIDLIDDFFQQLMPYFQEFGKERAQKLSKYSAARTGNV
jgi:hypothetical protein